MISRPPDNRDLAGLMSHSILVAHVAQSRRMASAECRWHHQDLADGVLIGLEKLSEARACLRFGSRCVVPSKDASRTLLCRVSPTTALLIAA